MISNEVQMLINRMRSNPEEFTRGQMEFGDRHVESRLGKWDNLMNSMVNKKPDLECLFTDEEIKALRETVYEILRPIALASIVRIIVGGDDTETNIQKLLNAKRQMELNYNSQEDTGKI